MFAADDHLWPAFCIYYRNVSIALASVASPVVTRFSVANNSNRSTNGGKIRVSGIYLVYGQCYLVFCNYTIALE